MFLEWALRKKPSVLGIISGAVGGLVAITPASGFVTPTGALVIGLVAGIACYWGAVWLKHAGGYDDSLDAFGVHGVGGIVGAILTGVFASEAIGGTAELIQANPADGEGSRRRASRKVRPTSLVCGVAKVPGLA